MPQAAFSIVIAHGTQIMIRGRFCHYSATYDDYMSASFDSSDGPGFFIFRTRWMWSNLYYYFIFKNSHILWKDKLIRIKDNHKNKRSLTINFVYY